MRWLENLFLTEEETKVLALYLAYGVGIGILCGLFLGKIEFCFALGGVISIIISLLKIYLSRIKKTDINKLL